MNHIFGRWRQIPFCVRAGVFVVTVLLFVAYVNVDALTTPGLILPSEVIKKIEEAYNAEVKIGARGKTPCHSGKRLREGKCVSEEVSLPTDYILAATTGGPLGPLIVDVLQRRIDRIGALLVPGFIPYLNSSKEAEVLGAAKQLIRIGTPEAARAVLDKIETLPKDPLGRILLLQNLRHEWFNPAAAEVFINRLYRTKQRDLAYELQEHVLHQIEGPELVRAIRKVVEATPRSIMTQIYDDKRSGIKDIMLVLERMTAPSATKELVRMCRLSKSKEGRIAAASSLFNIWTKESVAAFQQCVIPQELKESAFLNHPEGVPRKDAGEVKSIMFRITRGVDDQMTMFIDREAIRSEENIPGRPFRIETRKISSGQFRQLEKLIGQHIPFGYQYDDYDNKQPSSSRPDYSLSKEMYGRGIKVVHCSQCSKEFTTVRKKIEMLWATAPAGIIKIGPVNP